VIEVACRFLIEEDWSNLDEETRLNWEYLYMQIQEDFDRAEVEMPRKLVEAREKLYGHVINNVFGDIVEEIGA